MKMENPHRPPVLGCPTINCGTQYRRRDALEAAVQADPVLRNCVAGMGGGTTRDADLRSRVIWYGWDQNSLGVGPPLETGSLDGMRQHFATKNNAAAVGRPTRASELSCAWHLQPSLGRELAELGLGDAVPARAGDQAVVQHASSASLTGRPDQEAARVRVGRERQQNPSVPIDDGVHATKAHEATRCHRKKFGKGEDRTGVVTGSPCWRGDGIAARTRLGTTLSGQIGDAAHLGGQIPVPKPQRRFHGRGGCSAREHHPSRGWKCAPMAPGWGVRLTPRIIAY